MKTLPLGTHYHQRGCDQIEAQNSLDALVRRQQKQVNASVFVPIWLVLGAGWFLWLIASVCDYYGTR